MEALLDNDLLHKLTRYGLLGDFDRLLIARGFAAPHGRVPSAPWSMKTKKRPLPAALWPHAAEAKKFSDYCFQRCRGATGSQAASLNALNVPFFDAGEIALVARALEEPSAIVFTGDKRAIGAVASDPQLAAVKAALTGRFIHLEMVMESLSTDLGWTHVAGLVVASGVDLVLQRVYGQPTEEQMSRALAASIRRLRSQTDGLLSPAF